MPLGPTGKAFLQVLIEALTLMLKQLIASWTTTPTPASRTAQLARNTALAWVTQQQLATKGQAAVDANDLDQDAELANAFDAFDQQVETITRLLLQNVTPDQMTDAIPS